MSIVALTNDNWGFTTNCFVCEPRNDAGLRLPFFHDTVADVVFVEFQLDDRFSGAPTWAHGGVSLAICDEAMAWAAIAICHKWAVTRSCTAEFERPVRIGSRYRCEARVEQVDGERIDATARVSATNGKDCVVARATLAIVSAVQAPDLGIHLTAEHSDYLRP